MDESDPHHLFRELADNTKGESLERLRTSDQPAVLIAAALVDPTPSDLLARASLVATSTRDRQLLAIAAAHLAGDRARAVGLIQDHLLDHPEHPIVSWILAGRGSRGDP